MTPPPLSRDALKWLANMGLCHISEAPGDPDDDPMAITEATQVDRWPRDRWEAAQAEATIWLRARLEEAER